jgi:hypothetical protein
MRLNRKRRGDGAGETGGGEGLSMSASTGREEEEEVAWGETAGRLWRCSLEHVTSLLVPPTSRGELFLLISFPYSNFLFHTTTEVDVPSHGREERKQYPSFPITVVCFLIYCPDSVLIVCCNLHGFGSGTYLLCPDVQDYAM